MHKPINLIIVLIISIIVFCYCSSVFAKKGTTFNDHKSKVYVPSDSTLVKALRQHGYKRWEMDEINIAGDTLKFVSANDFFYYPFGKYRSIVLFNSENKVWGSPSIKIYTEPSTITAYIYRHLNSSLQVIKNPDTGLIELFNAKISDKDILFVKPITIGMSEVNFLRIFFSDINENSFNVIKVIKVESAVLGIWNNYYFLNGKLGHITFTTDYVLN